MGGMTDRSPRQHSALSSSLRGPIQTLVGQVVAELSREFDEATRADEPVSKTQVHRRQWRESIEFKHRVHAALLPEGVSFVEWLILETVQEAIHETRDAVSQVEIAHRAGLSERVVSYWMLQMSEYGAIDRAPTADGRAWRVLLTRGGRRSRNRCNLRLEAAGLTG